jgi:hypothetical protein
LRFDVGTLTQVDEEIFLVRLQLIVDPLCALATH